VAVDPDAWLGETNDRSVVVDLADGVVGTADETAMALGFTGLPMITRA